MNTSKLYLLLFLIVCLISSACNNSFMSVTKRQHRNGYYVHFKGKADVTDKKELTSEQIPERTGKEGGSAEVNSQPKKIAANDEKPVKSKADLSVKSLKLNNFRAAVNKISDPIKAVITKPIIKQNTASFKGEDAQSGIIKNFIWFCIVLLLLVYIIGVAAGGFGMGAAVHLFLIAALILLAIKLLTPL